MLRAGTPVIRSIEIERQDIFPAVAAQQSRSLYTWANYFHIKTREHIIRNELLFSEGDTLDQELLSESERKLRALAFLGEAEISIEPDLFGSRVMLLSQLSHRHPGLRNSPARLSSPPGRPAFVFLPTRRSQA